MVLNLVPFLDNTSTEKLFYRYVTIPNKKKSTGPGLSLPTN